MVWVGKDLKDHRVPTPLPWAGTPSTRPGCSELHPAWPWTLPGRGQPQFQWAAWASVSPPSILNEIQFTRRIPVEAWLLSNKMELVETRLGNCCIGQCHMCKNVTVTFSLCKQKKCYFVWTAEARGTLLPTQATFLKGFLDGFKELRFSSCLL